MNKMKSYLGVKMINAKPMTQNEYFEYTNDEIRSKDVIEGYLVEYLDSPNKNHPDHENYISWSPKDVFEKAYRVVDGLTFGLAIEALKKGLKVARSGWNGKNMFVYMVEGHTVTKAELLPGALETHVEPITDSEEIILNAHIDMKAADGTVVVGWLASQTDILAEDWGIVE